MFKKYLRLMTDCPDAALGVSQRGRDNYPVQRCIRATASFALSVFVFACLSAGTAQAQTWRLAGPPEFMPSQSDGLVFQPGTSRKYASGDGLITTTLNSRTATSATFTTTSERWGTGTVAYSWDSPPEILHTGDVVAFNIRWNIGQKWRDWCPQMGTLVHLDWSEDWYTTQWYGYSNHPVSPASGQEPNTVIKVTGNNPTELIFYVAVHSTPGDVRVQWKYRRVEEDVPPSSGGAGNDISGKWNDVTTVAGTVTITQDGNSISGTYDHGEAKGTITGTKAGKTIRGSWTNSLKLSGTFEWVLSPDGKEFSGFYVHNGEKGRWSGSRIDSTTPFGSFSGRWTGTYRNTLGDSGPSTLTLREDGERITGDQDGVPITNATRHGSTVRWSSWTGSNGNLGRTTYTVEITLVGTGKIRCTYKAETSTKKYSGSVDYTRQ